LVLFRERKTRIKQLARRISLSPPRIANKYYRKFVRSPVTF
jgi:hypothetical protein